MQDSSYKVQCILATLLNQFEASDLTKNTVKVIKAYRRFIRHEYTHNRKHYTKMSTAASDAWAKVNGELNKQGVGSKISLPVSFITLWDMLPDKASERVCNAKAFHSMLEHHTDYEARTRETEDGAIIMGDVLRKEFELPPRPKLSFIKQMQANKKFNDILEKG